MNPAPLSRTHGRSMSAIRSALRVFLLFFPMTLLFLLLHEGGHAIVDLIYRAPHTDIFIHPFAFAGFSRPIFDFDNILFHAGGTILSILVSLSLFLILWKRRSSASLLPLILFPWAALAEGLALLLVLTKTGDYYNVSQVVGLPAGMFALIGVLFFLTGLFLFISLFPRLGLAPESMHALWVIPASMGVYGLVGLGVAHWLVPASPFLLQYGLVQETLNTANVQLFILIAIGLLTAGLYVSLYRAVYRKFPASWRAETAQLTWRDLRCPAVLAAISIAVGLAFILGLL